MKKILLLLSIAFSFSARAYDKDSLQFYELPDSVKAVQLYSEVKFDYKKLNYVATGGIQTDVVSIFLQADPKGNSFTFEFPKTARLMVMGLNCDRKDENKVSFKYNWTPGSTYRLLVSEATDSAGNYSWYSGYVWLSNENRWKLLGSCEIKGRWTTIKQPATFSSTDEKDQQSVHFDELWIQRSNSSWQTLLHKVSTAPTINLYAHIDSVAQKEIDNDKIKNAIASGIVDADKESNSIFYKIVKEGSGKYVNVNDTVTAYYHLNLLGDTTTIDQAKDKPATFPLNRLIDGWKQGLALCKVGGKIRMILPSHLAYTIRTRSSKIPPNSILVFEIEVVDAKSPI